MDLQVVAFIFWPELTLQIDQIILNHYSHNLHHYYKITINYNLQSNYTKWVLDNILEHCGYCLGVVVPAVS